MVLWESKLVLLELWGATTIPVWKSAGFYHVENQVDELKAMAENGTHTMPDAMLPGGEGNDFIIMIMVALFAMTAIGLVIYLFEKIRRDQNANKPSDVAEHVLFIQDDDDENMHHTQATEEDAAQQDSDTTKKAEYKQPQAIESYTAMAEALPLINEDVGDEEEVAISTVPREVALGQSYPAKNVVHLNPTPSAQETEKDTGKPPIRTKNLSAVTGSKDGTDNAQHDVTTTARDRMKMDQRDDPDSKSEAPPYIAPIVKDDLARADARNDERMATLRSDVSLQIERFKLENNSRLDTIISALDSKIDDITKLFSNYAKADAANPANHPHLLTELQLLREKIDTISVYAHQETTQPLAERLDAVQTAISNHTIQLEQKIQSAAHNAELDGQLKTVDQKIGDLHNSIDGQAQHFLTVKEILEERLGTISYLYSEVGDLSERVNALNTGIDRLHKSTKHSAVHKSMAVIKLTDVVRSTLHEDEYEFGRALSNHHQTDCMIHLPNPPGPIAIDSQFPVNAYNALPPAHEVEAGSLLAREAENDFRRAMLKHIIDVASTCIIPEETANVALIFIPTEEIYTTIHNRFPDLVRDSFRSCVWLISPATLMGSLHTIKGILKEVPEKADLDAIKQEKEEVLAEITELRAQAQILASTFANTQTNLNSLLMTTDQMASKAGIFSADTPPAQHTMTSSPSPSSDSMVPSNDAETTTDTPVAFEEPASSADVYAANPYAAVRMQSIEEDTEEQQHADNDDVPDAFANTHVEIERDAEATYSEGSSETDHDGPEWPGQDTDKNA